MFTRSVSSNTLHECTCCCVVPRYYRLGGWLQLSSNYLYAEFIGKINILLFTVLLFRSVSISTLYECSCLLMCSPWILQISHYIWRMITRSVSSSTLHECICCCAVPGYYRLVIISEGCLQGVWGSSTLYECSCCCAAPGYYRLVITSRGWLKGVWGAAPFIN